MSGRRLIPGMHYGTGVSYLDDHCRWMIRAGRTAALNVDDVLELRLSEVDQPINSPLDLDRHISVRVHHILLTLHGFAARYVTGALLASRRWLHRKAGIRQVSVPRGLSDATPTGGGQ